MIEGFRVKILLENFFFFVIPDLMLSGFRNGVEHGNFLFVVYPRVCVLVIMEDE